MCFLRSIFLLYPSGEGFYSSPTHRRRILLFSTPSEKDSILSPPHPRRILFFSTPPENDSILLRPTGEGLFSEKDTYPDISFSMGFSPYLWRKILLWTLGEEILLQKDVYSTSLERYLTPRVV